MKNILVILSSFLIFFSCKNAEDKIEIYLLKERIRSSEGVSLIEYAKKQNLPIEEEITSQAKANYDTLKKQFIYGGKFDVIDKDISKKPLIEDNEVLGLNLSKSEFLLSTSGEKKIESLKPNMKFGIQFVICVNRKPCLTGYFRSNISSYIYNWNYIGYDYFKHDDKTAHDKNFVIRQNAGYEKWKPILTKINEYPSLISALKKTNRLHH
ncbi:hypothetical protein HYN48_13595 [Flavobacterium magnum]|uniref:Lipoprotein n=1 Tax=Flavobacterium magnum TaxID=2162713 RepID=A0A2S0RJY4_9FLAO|nr:hypothetical protein [Flavobacterium magnum]AWA31032.1 hypothetical protein HYN48_13595 [Flavobacterium magnum]